ncbi:hypothetical protein OG864_49725 [Streptomyces sp. NBC_00124]|nr:hypothetical protein [Streptomyces sp. NBC_00124]MCX5366777.1 hypothetical protein [Streptomyces sp. NBC_00124]
MAGGAAVGNLYWAQPLLDFIAQDLHVLSGFALVVWALGRRGPLRLSPVA